MSLQVHIVVPELFMNEGRAKELCAGLRLPALEKILARSQQEIVSADFLEDWLCDAFGVADSAVAPVSLRADGVEPGAGYWLRADPVHLHIGHDLMTVQPLAAVSPEDAERLCESLNLHFAAEGMQFMAPNPQRWYLRLEQEPMMTMHSLSEAVGRDVRDYGPEGDEALRWDGLLNEIQMVLFQQPVNRAREEQGELMVNSLWLWGGGYASGKLRQPCSRMFTNSTLAAAFAAVADVGCVGIPDNAEQYLSDHDGKLLIVWEGLSLALQHGDIDGWCASLQRFEQDCIAPLFQALRNGLLEKITLDVLQKDASRRFVLTRRAARKFWRHAGPRWRV
jgi:hypothetical protein